LLFLGRGIWHADIYQDDLQLPFNPNGILIKSININLRDVIVMNGSENPDILKIPLAAGGGFAIRLEKQ